MITKNRKIKKLQLNEKNIRKLYDKKIILFGASNQGKQTLNYLKSNKINIQGFSDNDKSKWGRFFENNIIYSPNELKNIEFDYILIASMYVNEIFDQLVKLQIEEEKIKKAHIPDKMYWKNKTSLILPYYYKLTGMLKRKGISSKITSDAEIIISLTTIPSRIDKVWLSIESLLRQSYKPNRIILWISEDEFRNIDLPKNLIRQIKRGLEIQYCDNLLSYKKYYYSLKENPNSIIVTVDDDVIYPSNMLEKLVKVHEKYPMCIVCNRAKEIVFDDKLGIKKYNEWKFFNEYDHKIEPSQLLVQIGCGGVLYPPKSLYKDVLNEKKFLKLSPKADDLWLKAMALLNNTQVVWTSLFDEQNDVLNIDGTQEIALSKDNVVNNQNDSQMKNLVEEYNLLPIILSDIKIIK